MYDPKCEELARHFLGEDAPGDMVMELAQYIQCEIELWLEEIEANVDG